MNIIEHLILIDNIMDKKTKAEYEYHYFMLNNSSALQGMGFAGVPWSQNTPWSVNQDTDHDGIPDALDNHLGWGANAHSANAPWSQNTPWSVNQDTDHDGIPDALDNHLGWGANSD